MKLAIECGAPVHDEKFSAAFAVKTCLDLDGSAAASMFWCCSDLFEEQFMLPKPFVGSYGVVSNDGIPKPNFWAFKLLSGLYPRRLPLRGTQALDCGVFTDGKNVQILLTAQDNDYHAQKTYDAEFTLDFAAGAVTVQRIDDTHCNPKAAWRRMGAPDNLTRTQAAAIAEETRLREEPHPFAVKDGGTTLSVRRHALLHAGLCRLVGARKSLFKISASAKFSHPARACGRRKLQECFVPFKIF